jgi:two-component system, cell cycle sensor histidine kinase and response regulator CckA
MLMDPGINGCETYRQIIKYVPGQKAIITSGYSSNEDINRAMDMGVSQFIKKPYSLQELAQALKWKSTPLQHRLDRCRLPALPAGEKSWYIDEY